MEKSKLIAFIRKNQPLLNGEQTSVVASFFRESGAPKGELLIEEGKINSMYFYLESGCVRSYTYNLEGEDITTGLYSSGKVVCDLMSFFKRTPAMENYQALCDCRFYFISFEELQKAFHALPEFREFGRAVLVSEYGALKERMLSSLHQTAEERYANLLKSNPDIFQYAPLKNIASYLGITDTSLSRIRKEFVRK